MPTEPDMVAGGEDKTTRLASTECFKAPCTMHCANGRYACDPNHQTAEPHNYKTFFAYRYGYLDKVMSVHVDVSDSNSQLTTPNLQLLYTYEYHADGQLARANYGSVGSRVPRDRGSAPTSESFLWDGLALIQRGDEQFVNEPHIGNAPKKLCFGWKPRAKRSARRARKGPRGNPVASSKGTSYFNDALGTTVGAKKDGKYSVAVLDCRLVGMIDCAPRWGRKESFFLAKLIVTVHEVGTFPRNVRGGEVGTAPRAVRGSEVGTAPRAVRGSEVGTAPRAVHDLDAADCGRVVDASLPDDAE